MAAVAIVAAGCASPPAPGNSTTPTTTTGLIPDSVPTEGTRPAADKLPRAAEPQSAPLQTAPIPGRTVAVGDAPEGVVVDAATRTVAVATRNPNELVLLNADTGAITGRTPLPGFARHLQLAAPGGPVLAPA
jgi:hypothetical protein